MVGVIRVINQFGVLIEENRTRFFERNAMLLFVSRRFSEIPFKLDIAYNYIVVYFRSSQ